MHEDNVTSRDLAVVRGFRRVFPLETHRIQRVERPQHYAVSLPDKTDEVSGRKMAARRSDHAAVNANRLQHVATFCRLAGKVVMGVINPVDADLMPPTANRLDQVAVFLDRVREDEERCRCALARQVCEAPQAYTWGWGRHQRLGRHPHG